MRLTSKERVLASFAHIEGDRVPLWCGASDEFWAKAKRELALDDEGLRVRFGDDFRRVWARYAGPQSPLSPGATYRTVFGIERHGIGYGMPLSHPLANASLADVEAYPWPEPAWMDVSHIRDDAMKYKGQYAILGGDWSPFWHDAIDLFGMEGLMVKMYEEPEVIDAAMKRIVDYYFDVSKRIFDAAAGAIDIYFIGNDLGGQQGPLLGEGLFMRFVLPHIQRLVELGHAYELKVMMHCCGGISEFIPALITIGLDGLHAVQTSCRGMELDTLKRQYGAKMVFNGAIDSHHVLIKGTPALVRQKTREVLDIMMPGGGFVAGASHDAILGETPVENVLAMFDTVREFGVYA